MVELIFLVDIEGL